MPYVTCGRCGLKTFSAAYWSSVDYCDRCGTPFARARREVVSIARLRRRAAPPPASTAEEQRPPRVEGRLGTIGDPEHPQEGT